MICVLVVGIVAITLVLTVFKANFNEPLGIFLTLICFMLSIPVS